MQRFTSYNPGLVVAWILRCDNTPQAVVDVCKSELEFYASLHDLKDYTITALYEHCCDCAAEEAMLRRSIL